MIGIVGSCLHHLHYSRNSKTPNKIITDVIKSHGAHSSYVGELSVALPWYKWLTARPSQDGHTAAPERSWHCCKVPGNYTCGWHNSKITLCIKDTSLLPWCHAEFALQFKWQLNKSCRNCNKWMLVISHGCSITRSHRSWLASLLYEAKQPWVLVVSTVYYGSHHLYLYFVTNIHIILLVESQKRRVKFCACYGNGYIHVYKLADCIYAGSLLQLPVGCL